MSPERLSRCLSCIQLLLLGLPPRDRRRLQIVIRFMNGVSNNHCLKLDPRQENRYAVNGEDDNGMTGESEMRAGAGSARRVRRAADGGDRQGTVPAYRLVAARS